LTHLRKMMLEELERRNYAQTTIDCYLRAVAEFSFHFYCSPKGLRLNAWKALCWHLHNRKLERFANDPEVYQLYRRVVDERPGLIHDYAARMTRLVAMILADGVRKKEYNIDDIGAAEVVRDAVTVYVHPAHVEAAAKVGLSLEPAIKRTISTLNIAFRSGLSIAPSKRA
jgi:Tetracyclin repressor-like, C-terminal domain